MPVLDEHELAGCGGEADSEAMAAEVLYLLNLLLFPVVAFLVMIGWYFYRASNLSSIAADHFRQAIATSLWGALLLVVVNVLLLLLGGYDGPYVWAVVIVYFTVVHASFVLLGIVGLIKALAGQYWRYPLIGLSRRA